MTASLPNQWFIIQSLLWIVVTTACYAIGLGVKRIANGNALANPVLIAIALVAVLLVATGTPYAAYFRDTWILTYLLGPATVALGVPLGNTAPIVRANLKGVLLGLAAGSLTSMLSGVALVRVLGGSRLVALSMLPKAVTTPIAIGVSVQIGGLPGLTATLAIIGGIVAAITMQFVLTAVHVTREPSIGLAAGNAGSGIAAAHVARLGVTPAAFAAIGIGLNGLLTALIAPVIAAMIS